MPANTLYVSVCSDRDEMLHLYIYQDQEKFVSWHSGNEAIKILEQAYLTWNNGWETDRYKLELIP